MRFDVSTLRKDTESDRFPYGDRAVTFIHIDRAGLVTADHAKSGKVAMLEAFRPGELLVASWKGAYRADLFSVDRATARKALGMETS